MTTAIAFCGPSTNALDLSQWPGIMLAGPAEAGDIAWAATNGYTRIGLVDGYFGATRAPWHKEILFAVDAGVQVLGASSMGALRAAELDGHGMAGIGRVYALYADGTVTADDEVTLLHGPADAGYVPLTEALVNVRLNVQDFIAEGLIDQQFGHALITAGRTVHYKDRTIETIGEVLLCQDHGKSKSQWGQLRQLWQDRAIDWKAQDAADLLDQLASPARQRTPSDGATPGRKLVNTDQFQLLLNEIGVT